MGGELRPELQASIFEDDYVLGTYAQDFDTCVQTTHASYMLNYQAFNEDGTGYLGEERAHAEASALAMGYTFEITAASAELSALDAGTVEAQIHIEFALRPGGSRQSKTASQKQPTHTNHRTLQSCRMLPRTHARVDP